MDILTPLDLAALAWFLAGWLGFHAVVELSPLRKRTLSHAMNRHRIGWMMEMSRRPVRIMDIAVAGGLQQGTGFFASTSLLAIGGCFALLTSTESVFRIMQDLGLDEGRNPATWELKVIGLTLIYAYAFFKFGWAYRLFNYATIMMGAMPDGDPAPAHVAAFAKRAGGMMVLAGSHFNRGQRAFFFSIGYLGWFADARVFFVTTLFVMIVLARRQFASRARTLAVSAHQSPSEPMADKGAMKTDTGSANPFT